MKFLHCFTIFVLFSIMGCFMPGNARTIESESVKNQSLEDQSVEGPSLEKRKVGNLSLTDRDYINVKSVDSDGWLVKDMGKPYNALLCIYKKGRDEKKSCVRMRRKDVKNRLVYKDEGVNARDVIVGSKYSKAKIFAYKSAFEFEGWHCKVAYPNENCRICNNGDGYCWTFE